MIPTLQEFLQIDLPALSAAIFSCVSCALAGTFLVLRRQSLMGDALSHAILPGIVAAFILTQSRARMAMLTGALVSGLLASALIEALRRWGRIEPGAAMGVVFSIFFALGILLIEQTAAHKVDLDADCVLYGQLETIFWLAPRNWRDLIYLKTWQDLPVQVITLAGVMVFLFIIIWVFFKELVMVVFDPVLAALQGFRPGLIQALITVCVALSAVAAFEAVGSILVIAMLICPAATMRLLTDRLKWQIIGAPLVGLFTAVVGYALAAWGPYWWGDHLFALNIAGMIAVVAGLFLGLAVLFATRPRHSPYSR